MHKFLRLSGANLLSGSGSAYCSNVPASSRKFRHPGIVNLNVPRHNKACFLTGRSGITSV